MTPATLRTRIAASDASDQGEIVNAAYHVLLPKPHIDDAINPIVDWYTQNQRFNSMCRTLAYTDAPLLFANAALPDIAHISVSTYHGWQGGDCSIVMKSQGTRVSEEDFARALIEVELPNGTPAIAIIDAVCAAVEKPKS